MCGRLLLVILLEISVVYGLECYDCTGIHATSECHTLITCPADNVCSTVVSRDGNNQTHVVMGCKPKQQCQPISTTQMPTHSTNSSGQSPSNIICSNCCSKRTCNGLLCSTAAQSGPGSNQCEDDPVFDCAYVSTTFNLCSDIAHAKTVCKKFCNLCDVVDGKWTVWGGWSACDTSCGNGSTIRIRTCTNPSPAHGGSDCTGVNKQTGSCHLQDCPVHGGWSSWSPWGSCSKTCGMGLQRRDRSCSNPYPALYGDHCFGDDKVYRACFERACVDGGWSIWSTWGTCSATCNGGLSTRTRNCTNPQPSQFGRDCRGNDMDYLPCNTQNCPARQVGFTVNTPTGKLVDQTPTFSVVVLNGGGAYNTSTGRFTCPIQGIYLFTMTLLSKSSRSSNVYCDVYQNTALVGQPYVQSGDIESASVTLFIHLLVGDVVYLRCNNWDTVYYDINTLYSGLLIKAD